MMIAVRNGEIDRVIVYSFSRFARSVTHLLKALEEFKGLKVSFISVTEQIQTDSPMGKAIFVILSAISQLERELLIERVRNGLANAKAKGIHIGRKKTRPSELIRKLYLSGVTYREAGRIAGVSSGAIGSEVRLLKEELGVEKVKELRRKSNRRPVLAYKPAPILNEMEPMEQKADIESTKGDPIEMTIQ